MPGRLTSTTSLKAFRGITAWSPLTLEVTANQGLQQGHSLSTFITKMPQTLSLCLMGWYVLHDCTEGTKKKHEMLPPGCYSSGLNPMPVSNKLGCFVLHPRRLQGIDSVDVLGWSDGANVGVLLAAANPKRVRRLCIFGATAFISAEDVEGYEATRDVATTWSDNMRVGNLTSQLLLYECNSAEACLGCLRIAAGAARKGIRHVGAPRHVVVCLRWLRGHRC